MEPGEGPEMCSQDMDEIQLRLEDPGDMIFEDHDGEVILKANTSYYDLVRTKCYTKRNVGLNKRGWTCGSHADCDPQT